MAEPVLSERQRKWFATIREGLERETGKSMAEWMTIARACPESGHRARLNWFKAEHGLLQNRASLVLSEAFETTMGWSNPDALIDALWTDPASRSIFEAVNCLALALPGAIQTPRKGYTAWTRNFQFAALKPVKGGLAMLGLAASVDSDPRLTAPRSASWSERLTSSLNLAQVDDGVAELLRRAWERS